MSLLTTRDLVAGYTDADILSGVSIDVGTGELVTVIGPNGAGKSTLLKAICGLVEVRGGTVTFDGADITGAPAHRVVRAGLGYVPQLDNVFASLTVAEHLEIGAARPSPQRLDAIYGWFPALADRTRARAETLSGGQRQMLALARALVAEPTLLLLDEPSAGLAPKVVTEIFATIARINDAGTAVLLIEQNARRALALSHRGYVLDLGRNRFEGSGAELLDDPKVVELYLGGHAEKR